ncbi:MAG: B12-binding domain-containing radical SAM protein [Nitrospinota bacterium]
MKILLMVPPPKNALTLELSNEIAQSMGNFPPLGILYLATYLKERTDFELRVLDSEALGYGLDEVEEVFKEFQPDVVGITAFTNTLYDAVQTIKSAKKILPQSIICLGGPHVALYPEESLHFNEVDFAIAGDGEISFHDLLKVLSEKELSLEAREERLKKIDGLIFRTKKGVLKNGYARIMDLDALPIPDRSFLDTSLYYCILGKKRTFTTVMSSRGCPFQCTFCNTPDKIYRYRNPVGVVDEIEDIAARGIEEIFFFDDLFNISEKRVIAICDEIIRRNIKIHWAFRGRVNGVTEELIVKAKAAGCERVQFGIEKGSNNGLKLVKKGITVEEVRKAVDLTKKHGLTTVGNFLIGTPEETKADILQTIDFSLTLKLDHAEFNTFTPYPGTQIYEDGLRSGLYPKDLWREFALNPHPDFTISWNEILSDAELNRLNVLATKKFYFRPRIFWNELKSLTSFEEFKRKLSGAKIVLGLRA